MATVIRFSRHGKKKMPYFRIVVQDSRSPRDGKFIEHIGSFDPIKGVQNLQLKKERLEYWIATGAQLSDSVRTRLHEWRKHLALSAPPTPKAPPPKKKAAKEAEAAG